MYLQLTFGAGHQACGADLGTKSCPIWTLYLRANILPMIIEVSPLANGREWREWDNLHKAMCPEASNSQVYCP